MSVKELTHEEYLEVVEHLLEMTARKELEIAELKAQLDVFKPKDVDLHVIDEDGGIKGKIMLVFMSRTLRDILKTMFENSGYYSVDIIDQYDNAPSTYALKKPDVCIIEHGTYGQAAKCIEITKEIRKMSKEVGIISIIPENDVEVIREVVTSGVDDFLVKPIDTRRMNNVIFDIIMKRNERKVS